MKGSLPSVTTGRQVPLLPQNENDDALALFAGL